MELARAIKEIRVKSLMNQTEFAGELGVAFSTLNRWENGKARPNLKAMKALKSFCNAQEIDYSAAEEAWITSKVREV